MNKINLSINEFCREFGIGKTLLYRMWREGTGPAFVRVGSRRLIPVDAAKSWTPGVQGQERAA